MARLPTPGGDDGDWGDILNDFLDVSHNSDGTLVNNSVGTPQLQDGLVTNAKLDTPTQTAVAQAASAYQKPAGGIPENDLASSVQTSLATADSSVQAVNGKSPVSGAVTLAASDVGALAGTESADAPGSPATNDLWYDSTNDLWKRWNGSAWVITDSNTYAPIITPGVVVGASGVLAINTQSYCSAASGSLTMTLPTGQATGSRIIVTKSESSTNTVTLTGNLQGIATQSYVLSLVGQTVELEADSSGSWWPISSRYDLSVLDNRYQLAGSAVGASLAYAQIATSTAVPTTTTYGDLTGTPLAISPILGTRAVEITTYLTVQMAAATTVTVGIFDATSSTIIAGGAATGSAGAFVTIPVTTQVTPGAGTRAYRTQIKTLVATTCSVYGQNNGINSFIAAIQR